MNYNCTVGKSIGCGKYFTLLYWKLQITSLFRSGKPLDSIEIIEIDPDSDFGKLLKKYQR